MWELGLKWKGCSKIYLKNNQLATLNHQTVKPFLQFGSVQTKLLPIVIGEYVIYCPTKACHLLFHQSMPSIGGQMSVYVDRRP